MFDGQNVIVLDLETLHSADDLETGWRDKPALGLSIGCYYDYKDARIHWFDVANLVETMQVLVARKPLLVSFNGIGFDFPLMRGLVRRQASALDQGFGVEAARADELQRLCDRFKELAATSYDVLAEVWRVDPSGKFTKGLNSLDALAAANGLPSKLGDGAQAPKDWANGEHAKVLNYCQQDVYITKALAELVAAQCGRLRRSTGDIAIRYMTIEDEQLKIVEPYTMREMLA